MKARFFRLDSEEDKEGALRLCIAGGPPQRSSSPQVFEVDVATFSSLPGAVFCYWERKAILDLFDDFPSIASSSLESRQGLATADDFRFVRLRWESENVTSDWLAFAKGGRYSTFYADLNMSVRWPDGIRQMLASINAKGEVRSNVWMLDGTIRNFFCRPALRWTRTALGGRRLGLGVTVLPAKAAFNDKSCAVFAPADDPNELAATLAKLSSSCVDRLFRTVSPTRSWEVGHLRSIPWPTSSTDHNEALARLAARGWSLRRSLDTVSEVSHAFVVPALLQVEGGSFSGRLGAWGKRVASVEAALDEVQTEIDELCFELYGISEEDRHAITDGFEVTADIEFDGLDDESHDSGDDVAAADPLGLAARLVSWAVGVAVGRFDVRLATGGREWPVEPAPFDPLPLCSPAMLVGEDGLAVTDTPAAYPVGVSPVLVEDPGHRLDLTTRVRAVFDVVFGGDADQWWADVGAALGAKSGEVGPWLGKALFDHHLRTHSKSRRKAPILWPIGSRSGSYLVWLYAHRVSPDTLFQILNDLVSPKVTLEEQQLTRLRQDAGPEPTASQRKVIEKQEDFVSELRELREALEAVTPLWAPDFNDGIAIVLSPLWGLFAHHRAWSKELKQHWGKLAKGEYDWAKLAMHLWPERVILKCAEDRSIAIAHGLEEVFWCQDDTNVDKWHPRVHPTTPIDQLIAERQNPAVVAALQHLENS